MPLGHVVVVSLAHLSMTHGEEREPLDTRRGAPRRASAASPFSRLTRHLRAATPVKPRVCGARERWAGRARDGNCGCTSREAAQERTAPAVRLTPPTRLTPGCGPRHRGDSEVRGAGRRGLRGTPGARPGCAARAGPPPLPAAGVVDCFRRREGRAAGGAAEGPTHLDVRARRAARKKRP